MKLTQFLLRRNLLPNGHLFRGKDRLVQEVKSVDLRRLKQDFEIEEQNMFYLRYPYLTETQSSGHAKALNKHNIRKDKLMEETSKIFKQDVTLAERLMHLRVTESWD